MYVRRDASAACISMIADLEKVLVGRPTRTGSVMPGYTHLQRAQPTTFAHAMMAYARCC